MDVLKYLKRIEYNEELLPNYKGLCGLQKAHMFHIPFENLDIHYGKTISLDLNDVYKKIVENRRGGFCFEVNYLFFNLLSAIGFDAKMISARVYDHHTENFGQAYDHLAIVVTIEGQLYLVDVGFGESSILPLVIEPGKVQSDSRFDYVIENEDVDCLCLYTQKDDKNNPEYLFSLQECDIREFDAMCVYHQTSEDSVFTQKRLITIPIENGRVSISGDKFKITRDNKVIKETGITSDDEFKALLCRYFRYQ